MPASLTPAAYLKSLPDDRRALLSKVRTVVLKHLPAGYEEATSYGMLSYQIPLTRYPKTYNKLPLQYVGLASKKNHCALYLTGAYMSPAIAKQLEQAFTKAKLKLDMGKGCLRFSELEDLPLTAIGECVSALNVDAYLKLYEASRAKK